VFVIDQNQLPANVEPEVGQLLQGRQENGQTFVARITNVATSNITLDANHPLAGKDLIFDIQLIEIL
jgi:peptidylprolyl isomerase